MAFPSPTTYPGAGLYPAGPSPSAVPFPSCPVLDRFMRPDTTDLGELWDGPSLGAFYPNGLEVAGRELIATGSNGNAMTVGSAATPADAFAQISAQGGSGSLTLFLVQGPGSPITGYSVEVNGADLELRRWDGGSTLLESVSVATAAGHWFGIRVADGAVEGWTRAPAGVWTRQAVATDATHAGPFRMAPMVSDAGGVSALSRVGFGPTQPGKVHPAVLIDWDASTTDAMLIGSGTIGSALIGGRRALQPSFVHEYADVTPYVQTVDIQRGRLDNGAPSYSGRCELTLRDPDSRFVPNTTNSLGYSVAPVVGMRVIASHLGDDYNLFTGYVSRGRQTVAAAGRDARTVLSAEDASTYLSSARVGVPAFSGTPVYTGQAAHELVDLWLSQVGFPWRNVGTASDTSGLSWTGFEDSPSGGPASDAPTALALIQDLLTADRGQLYVDAGGTVTYRPRLWRYPGPFPIPSAAILGTITDVVGGMEPTMDVGELVTRVVVNGGTVGVESATRPFGVDVDRFGYRDLSVSSAFFQDVSHVDDLARFLLAVNTGAGAPRRAVLTTGRDGQMTDVCLRAELNYAVSVDVPGISGAFGEHWIDGIEHRWEPGEPLRTTLVLGYHHSSSGVLMDSVS